MTSRQGSRRFWTGILGDTFEEGREATTSSLVPFDFGKGTQLYKVVGDQEQHYYHSQQIRDRERDRPDVTNSRSKVDQLALDARWGNLPDDLIDRILAWLPLPTFFVFRVICKRWNEVIYSPSFYHLCSHVPQTGPWFVISANESYKASAAYDPLSNRWYTFRFPGASVSRSSKGGGDLGHPIAAADGLVCSCLFQDGSEYLCVCNPMTKACTKPVRIPVNSDNVLAGMVVDKRSKAYRIVIAECSSRPKTNVETASSASSSSSDTELEENESYEVRAFVYDSRKPWSWKTGASLATEGHLDSGSAMCGGILYFVTHGAYKPNGLIAYDVELDRWKRINVTMPRLLLYAYLVDRLGRLIMIGGLGKFSVTTKIWLWELDLAREDLVLVGKLPPKLFKEFFSMSPSKYFMCAGQGDLLYLCTYKNTRGLVYDLRSKMWRFLPNCPVIAKHPSITPSGFCFEPRLDGSVNGRFEPDSRSHEYTYAYTAVDATRTDKASD